MTFTLLHPSRGRPAKAHNTFLSWKEKADKPDSIQHILSIDIDDPFKESYQSLFTSSEIVISRNSNVVDAVHSGISQVKNDCVIVLSDDFDCPENWDKILSDLTKGKEMFVVYTNDSITWGRKCMTLPIVSKTFIDKTGYIYFPQYTGMFADNDLYEMAERMDVLITANILFPHNHFLNKKAPMDATYSRHNTRSSWTWGERLLRRRRQINFNIK